MPNITLRDIAKTLGLSVSTVSKALRDSYEISEATKKRVVDFAQSNNYFPNRMAKSLKEGKSGSIGVVVCSIDNSFVSRMLDGIDGTCVASGYDIIIMQSKESLLQEQACLKQLVARGVEGVLISPSAESVDMSHIDQLASAGMPVVFFDRISERPNTHQVGIDNREGAFLATQHLIDNGYRRIAMLNIGPDIYFADQRGAGYREALVANGIDYRTEYVRLCAPTDRETLKASVAANIRSFFAMHDQPEALFTTTDQLSTHSLSALHELGYRIPTDLALIGFSNTEFAGMLTPPLSTVYQPAFEIGSQAADMLVDLIERKEHREIETIMLPVRLDVRASSQLMR
ncbi:LacI family DNA-binding transcriptional regulator [Parapedobacter sp. 10938]|uniref:LacI family DNA-binding transcriptional regulator n=1 Tax=Parapedobacter flavus TaxID=3110225 RepID=UPI002DC031F6|nr:LacI family DNA-binding transcriptional regulator [Parapedobacter sp. 10938]MEC3881537.1 LacI family DNA-binding transcriptional regulator [Parapedobacter sp. 10938]